MSPPALSNAGATTVLLYFHNEFDDYWSVWHNASNKQVLPTELKSCQIALSWHDYNNRIGSHLSYW